MSSTALLEQLADGLNANQRRLHSALLDAVAKEFFHWRDERGRALRAQEREARRQFGRKAGDVADQRDAGMRARREMLAFLGVSVEPLIDQLLELDRKHAEFRGLLVNTPSEHERQRFILEYAGDLGASPRQLRGDKRAFERWFGEDAVSDRYSRRKGTTEEKLVFYLDRLGFFIAQTLNRIHDPDAATTVWKRLELEKLTHAVLQYRGDSRVELGALRCLTTAVNGLPAGTAPTAISNRTRSFAERAAMDTHRDAAIQSSALRLLDLINPQQAKRIITARLQDPEAGDDMFVRRCCVRLLGRRLGNESELVDLVAVVATDPSSFVRQQLAEILPLLPPAAAAYWQQQLALEDTDPKVRAATLATAISPEFPLLMRAPFLELLLKVVQSESDAFVLRTALHVIAHPVMTAPAIAAATAIEQRDGLRDEQANIARNDHETVVSAIRKLQTSAKSLQVRRWAAQAVERIWSQLDPVAREVLPVLQERLAGLQPGKTRRIARSLLRGCDEAKLGRTLAVLAQDDFGWDLRTGWFCLHVTRGPVFRFRLWRLVHELLTPSTDKRQGFRHTIGRVSDATIRAPSQVLGELSETKVPGEPLCISEEGTWRPYLPLLDDMLSALDVGFWRRRPVQFYTSEGITEVMPPRGFLARVFAYFCLTFQFNDYAQRRNWRDGGGGSADAYLQELSRLGFRVRLRQHESADEDAEVDASVVRFFPTCFPLAVQLAPPLKKYLLEFAEYFGSLFDNSLLHLGIFILLAMLFFLAKHFYSNWTLRRARRSIGMSVGGWGTRGKSGTERLKAALFNALGCGVVSKSTGCEAMFMYSQPFGELREMLLYRPYDKATIWEHRNVLQMAADLKSSVFLWECMGLTPSYVEVLQQQWSRDDVATITNAYSDHEDVQGPAGWNVAQVIAGFVPRRSRVITTERQMLPLLRHAAARNCTSFRSVTWLESGLLTDDVLDRCPYKEHPDNVALVLAMAEELGCERDYALQVMADRLVPDLGVLKTYPAVELRSRTLEFTNGMSANERIGCMGNWDRIGYAAQDHIREPGVWLSTVVNNRADRVPRSRTFAKMLVVDLYADRHFLIGNNLKGLQGFIWEAFAEMAEGLTLWNDESDDPTQHALAQLRAAAHRYRQPYENQHVQAALAGMLQGLPQAVAELPEDFQVDNLAAMWSQPDVLARKFDSLEAPNWFADPVLRQLRSLLDSLSGYAGLADQIRKCSVSDRQNLDHRFVQMLRAWFKQKLIVIEDYDACGEEIIRTICEATPPGFVNRVMGIQNIKGTGLDFIYRWQAWEKCHQACNFLQQSKPKLAERGLSALAEFQDFGLLCDEYLRGTIAAVKRTPLAQRERFQAELDSILATHNQAMQQIGNSAGQQSSHGGLVSKLLALAEEFADVADAVKRRKTADQIYRYLVSGRISGERAVLELRALNKRQKGGWLSSSFRISKLAFTPQPARLPGFQTKSDTDTQSSHADSEHHACGTKV